MRFVGQSSIAVVTAAVLATAACTTFFERPGTPLAEAAWRGDVAAMRALVADGADPNAYDATGYTALHWAARGGHGLGPHRCRGEADGRPAVIAALLDLGADPDAADRRPSIIGGSSGWTPLHVALHHEQFRTATLLLERGADPNRLSHEGRSLMEMASREGAPRAVLEALLAHGFDAERTRPPDPR